jgi:hypothetical protein
MTEELERIWKELTWKIHFKELHCLFLIFCELFQNAVTVHDWQIGNDLEGTHHDLRY